MTIDLRQLAIFSTFNDDELACFTTPGNEYTVSPNTYLFFEGDPPRGLFVLLEGELEILKRLGDEEVLLAVMSPGSFVGEISLLTGLPHTASARALTQSRYLKFDPSQFDGVQESPVVALLLRTMAERLKNTEQMIQQHEKLSSLGKMAAGLAHEINNPAAANLRAAEELPALTAKLQSLLLSMQPFGFNPEHWDYLSQVHTNWIARAFQPEMLTTLQRSDREEALNQWMDVHEMDARWEFTLMLLDAGVTDKELDALYDVIAPTGALGAVFEWLECALTLSSLQRTLYQGSTRIVELVRAIKEYSFMDQSPMQDVNLHEGLDNTLTMLAYRLKTIQIIRDYDPYLPRVTVYGSQLNQVWTNLIDNAIDAMAGKGVITLRTWQDTERVFVEISDTGPGIPPEIQSRIFEPFFTTKGVGKGTGIGLDIVWRIIVHKHRGSIRVHSTPGDTRFEIALPVNRKPS
jgi:signal transduction histidine kinase